MIGIGKVVVGIVAATGVTAGVGYVAVQSSAEQAVVQRIVDGDTFEASVAGRTTSIRLLNVDTPETKDPNRDVECLGPEAAARLAQMIPVGSTVQLAFDVERLDRYDRTLAAVYDGQDRLVNAEIAREGLGTASKVGGNDRYYSDVVEAQEEARADGRGLYADTVACTVPSQVEALSSEATAAQVAATPWSSAEFDQAAAQTQGLLGRVDQLQSVFAGPRQGLVWGVLSAADVQRLTAQLSTSRDTVAAVYDAHRSMGDQARQRERVVEQQAAQAERDRQAQETATRQAQARQAAAARQDADLQASAPEIGQVAAAAAPAPTTAQAAGSGCEPGYSPCIPVSVKDLDCGDLGGPYDVTGSDKHRLDADDDGIGCER
ncbi:thermonuclease family protein [Pseudonocardia sp. KRD291]|uniref:thermonuclease family protein n=1 Tax=Pseudonocardia sp. KRD291 TaxID=2792007 RepID=UPI001C49D790|nr:thermonuclease family protein [Pseudonocardia sp. KRD291]MBW0101648.1 thermonuclease family protein [Pseudonocardia sp. KRD291]